MPQLPADKLSKLILMLSSQNDGEVVNAARAIDRCLKAAGADWHDLAQAIAPISISGPKMRPAPPGPPRDEPLFRSAARWCLERSMHLTEWEKDLCIKIVASPSLSAFQRQRLDFIARLVEGRSEQTCPYWGDWRPS